MRGLVSNSCNHLAKEIWTYCTDQKIWLSAVHVPGKDNNTADYMSRLVKENSEWRLAPFVFHKIVNLFKVTPEIDLFASALNHQVPKYISWNPDQEAFAIDAFSISWANIKFYAFPPFSLIGASISKIKTEGASGIMIIPLWNTQFWLPMMISLLQDFTVIFPPNILALPSIKISNIHFIRKWNCWQFIYQHIPQTSKHSTRNYRCYSGVVETNYKVKI